MMGMIHQVKVTLFFPLQPGNLLLGAEGGRSESLSKPSEKMAEFKELTIPFSLSKKITYLVMFSPNIIFLMCLWL